MGLNGMTIEKELDMDIKKIGSFCTFNEIREKWDMKPIDETGDIIGNSIFYQAYNQKKQSEMQQQQMGGGFDEGGNGDWNPFEEYENNEDNEGGEENSFEEYENGGESVVNDEELSEEGDNGDEEEKADSNIFVKAFNDFLEQEQNKN